MYMLALLQVWQVWHVWQVGHVGQVWRAQHLGEREGGGAQRSQVLAEGAAGGRGGVGSNTVRQPVCAAQQPPCMGEVVLDCYEKELLRKS